jgi:CRISPR/Cas system CSM-associated protein Csm5 (group 7 of RAMP superfamily)
MPKLKLKSFKLKAEIITPIHIDNGEVYDRLDYFVFDWWDVVQIVDRKWLNICAEKNVSLFNNIISSIEEWNFIELENFKAEFYEKYFDKSFLIKEISIKQQALKHLTMEDKDYSTYKNWIRWNLGEIKRFIKNKFWDVIIPWSTLKWLFRTIFLMLKKSNWYSLKEVKKLEDLDKAIKKDFSFIQFEDVIVKNPKLEIQWIKLAMENWDIPLPVEVLTWWEFEIKVNYDENYFKDLDLKKLLRNYSFEIVWREKRILDRFENFKTDLLNKFDEYYENDKYPIKIWMFKKSLSYKIFWKEELDDVYKKMVKLINEVHSSIKDEFNLANKNRVINLIRNRIDKSNLEGFYKTNKLWLFGFKEIYSFKKFISNTIKEKFDKKQELYVLTFEKPSKVVWQKLWIGDKSLYIDENQNPIWWISLEIIN